MRGRMGLSMKASAIPAVNVPLCSALDCCRIAVRNDISAMFGMVARSRRFMRNGCWIAEVFAVLLPKVSRSAAEKFLIGCRQRSRLSANRKGKIWDLTVIFDLALNGRFRLPQPFAVHQLITGVSGAVRPFGNLLNSQDVAPRAAARSK